MSRDDRPGPRAGAGEPFGGVRSAVTGASVALPWSEDAEQAVLSAILSAPEALGAVSALLTPEDFDRPPHAQVYAAMLEVAARGDTITPVTLCDVLAARGGLDAVGGKDFIAAD